MIFDEGGGTTTPLDLDPDLPPDLSPEDVEALIRDAQLNYWQMRLQWDHLPRGMAGAKPGEWQIIPRQTIESSPVRGDLMVTTFYKVNIRSKVIRLAGVNKAVEELKSE